MDPKIAARRLYAELGAPDIPSLLAAAVRHLGIDVIEGKAETIDAMLVHIKPGKPVIAVNTRRSVYRQRFSLAHEIGHFVLRHGNSVSFFENSRSAGGGFAFRPDARLEREANIFAAEFLMPKVALAREAHKFTLSELASRYMVSMQAMEIRLKELGLVCKGS